MIIILVVLWFLTGLVPFLFMSAAVGFPGDVIEWAKASLLLLFGPLYLVFALVGIIFILLDVW